MRNNPLMDCSEIADNGSERSAGIYGARSFRLIAPAEFLNTLQFQGEYCRYLWSWHAKKPWQAVGQRSRNRAVTTVTAFKADASGWCGARDEVLSSLDVFYTPNEFFDWRNTRQLAQLHANWLEIDTTDHAILDTDILDEVLAQLQAAKIPIPSGFVRSGSGGLHVYWIYDGCAAYKSRQLLWRQITDTLIERIPGGAAWHVDTAASRDPARVLRLPGSIHGRSGRLVNGYSSGVIYTMDALAASLQLSVAAPPLQVVPSDPIPKAKPIAPTPTPSLPAPVATTGRHTIRGWWTQTYWQIVSTIRRQRVQEGRRDLTAFMLYVALRHMHDDEQAKQTIETLNHELIGLPARELQSNLQTASKVRYRYKKATLAGFLTQIGVDPSYLYKSSPRLSADAIQQAQSNAGKTTSANRREGTLARIVAAAQDIAQGRMMPTLSAVAAASGRSARTVARYWREVVSVVMTNAGPSIYAP